MYSLNGVDLSSYGIIGSHIDGNISVKGCFDFPSRVGDTYYLWPEGEVDPYVEEDEIFFGGRSISFQGNIFGNQDYINLRLNYLYSDIGLFTDLVTFSSPYGNFSVYVENINASTFHGACSVTINMREPVVTLTGGILPATGENNYQIDGIPFSSFGFSLSKYNGVLDLSSLQTQNFTKYGSEGFQIVKRSDQTLVISGYIKDSSLESFNAKIKSLYLLLSSSGTRELNIGYTINASCFSMDGFTVSNVYVCNNLVIAEINIPLKVVSANYFYYLADEGGNLITDENLNKIIL